MHIGPTIITYKCSYNIHQLFVFSLYSLAPYMTQCILTQFLFDLSHLQFTMCHKFHRSAIFTQHEKKPNFQFVKQSNPTGQGVNITITTDLAHHILIYLHSGKSHGYAQPHIWRLNTDMCIIQYYCIISVYGGLVILSILRSLQQNYKVSAILFKLQYQYIKIKTITISTITCKSSSTLLLVQSPTTQKQMNNVLYIFSNMQIQLDHCNIHYIYAV